MKQYLLISDKRYCSMQSVRVIRRARKIRNHCQHESGYRREQAATTTYMGSSVAQVHPNFSEKVVITGMSAPMKPEVQGK